MPNGDVPLAGVPTAFVSASGNAALPAAMKRLPLKFTTARRTPSFSTTHQPLPGWLRR